jgi:parallel beta helix pectate lyase-like protein
MTGFRKAFHIRSHWLTFSFLIAAALIGVSFMSSRNVSANHPVLVEGNCDSPVPGTTIVNAGNCGDYDGDGRIGTAEDTDGADRIFGTINAALGPGTGASAGTGANFNGTITIVTSGRFAENIVISPQTAVIGNVTLEAAPGVLADIDAVLQGDPAGGNTTRQNGIGIHVVPIGNDRRIVLRNLTIRNFATGILLAENARVTIDNCRLENNVNYGIQLVQDARVAVFNTRIASTGYRIGGPQPCPSGTCTPTPGHGISFEGGSAGTVFHSLITGSFGSAISNTSSLGLASVRYYEVFLGKSNTGGIVNATRESTP